MLNFTADILLLLAVQAPGAPGAPAGHWINPRGTVIVEIAPCGGEAMGMRALYALLDERYRRI